LNAPRSTGIASIVFREFIETFIIEAVGKHLCQPAAVIEAAITSSRGDGIRDTDPLVRSLHRESLVRKYGLQVVVFDLVDCVLLQGMDPAKSLPIQVQIVKVESW
jgi:hypothetical protein